MEQEIIQNRIHGVRGVKVMLDKDLAELYQVTTGNLNKAVKRNIKRFPPDFMFQLTKEEWDNLIFQNGTSSWGGTRKLPYAFTEQGLAMLSGILKFDDIYLAMSQLSQKKITQQQPIGYKAIQERRNEQQS